MQENYRYIYKPNENPRERIRNKIQSLFTIVSLLTGKISAKKVKELKEKSEQDKEDILKLLSDIDEDYDFYEQ